MGEEDGCDGSLGIYFVYRTQMTKTKEQKPWNNTKQIYPEQKSKKSFVLRHLCPVNWTNCQFIWSRKVYIWLSSWEFQKLWLCQPCLNKLMNVENWETDHLQHDVDISYNFTLAWVFVSHACTQINMNTFINDLVLFRGIQC